MPVDSIPVALDTILTKVEAIYKNTEDIKNATQNGISLQGWSILGGVILLIIGLYWIHIYFDYRKHRNNLFMEFVSDLREDVNTWTQKVEDIGERLGVKKSTKHDDMDNSSPK